MMSEFPALEYMNKGDLYRWRTRPEGSETLLRKVRFLSRIQNSPDFRANSIKPAGFRLNPTANRKSGASKVIAMVSSTGGPKVLAEIFGGLNAGFPVPILVVQHMSPGFIQGLAGWLEDQASLRVQVAREGDSLRPGEILLAPDDVHMTVGEHPRIHLVEAPPVRGHRPSGNYLLESAGRRFGRRALGVVLTGMGRDGAEGMKHLKAAGGRTVVQDEATSAIFGMPKAAMDLGVVDQVLPPWGITAELQRFAGE
jgi:two-component system chemotaxis response regulator CheB